MREKSICIKYLKLQCGTSLAGAVLGQQRVEACVVGSRPLHGQLHQVVVFGKLVTIVDR
jgi:hypothetical protein